MILAIQFYNKQFIQTYKIHDICLNNILSMKLIP